jgi:lactoylglutathione lyase
MATKHPTLSATFAVLGIVTCGFFSASAAYAEEGLTAPITQGVNHIGFTVSDLEGTTALFVDTLGWREVGGVPSYPSRFVTDGSVFVTLWRATKPEEATPFDRKNNVGLHHFAMTVADLETLDELHATLEAHPKVVVEFAPQLNGAGPTVHMMVRGPSGLRLEFAVPEGRRRSAP